jgi:hypothetical protein
VSAAIAAAIVVTLARHLPVANQTHTDIVGYPMFADFNASRYPDIWYLAVIGWPLLSLLIFLVGRRVLRAAGLLERMRFALRAGGARPIPVPVPVETPIDPGSLTERVALGARVAAVALVWGFCGVIVRDDQGFRFWRDLLLIAAVYVLVVGLAAAVVSAQRAARRRPDRRRTACRLSAHHAHHPL